MRIVSLVPAATDLVAALGLARHLVGVSHACDHPLADGLPRLTRSRAPATGAQAIDGWVAAAARAGEPLYDVDEERLAALAPDAVLVQDVCEVCAVDPRAIAGLLPAQSRLVAMGAASAAGVAADARTLGALTGVEGAGETFAAGFAERLAAVTAKVAGLARPRLLALEWTDPPFLGGHWVPELVAIAGGDHLLAEPGEPSRRSTWGAIAEADPDVLVVMPCGYDLIGAVAEAERLSDNRAFRGLRAVREGRAWAVDANRFFSRCGPAMPRAAEILAGLLHPEACPPPGPDEAQRLSW